MQVKILERHPFYRPPRTSYGVICYPFFIPYDFPIPRNCAFGAPLRAGPVDLGHLNGFFTSSLLNGFFTSSLPNGFFVSSLLNGFLASSLLGAKCHLLGADGLVHCPCLNGFGLPLPNLSVDLSSLCQLNCLLVSTTGKWSDLLILVRCTFSISANNLDSSGETSMIAFPNAPALPVLPIL